MKTVIKHLEKLADDKENRIEELETVCRGIKEFLEYTGITDAIKTASKTNPEYKNLLSGIYVHYNNLENLNL